MNVKINVKYLPTVRLPKYASNTTMQIGNKK